MNINSIREGELKSVFDSLEEGFNKLSIDFYLIGAIARDIWFGKGGATSTGTKDVDFAVYISNKEDYQKLKQYLVKYQGFTESTSNDFVLIAEDVTTVDLLPFGEIEVDSNVNLGGTGLTSINVNGFKEVFDQGTESVDLESGHNFEVATLPAIVLLKLISFDDRPEQRLKDPRDIAGIIQTYFDLNSEYIYQNHSNIFDNEDFTEANASARIIGREIKTIIDTNNELMNRLIQILKNHISEGEESMFMRNMIFGKDDFLSTVSEWLSEMLIGLQE